MGKKTFCPHCRKQKYAHQYICSKCCTDGKPIIRSEPPRPAKPPRKHKAKVWRVRHFGYNNVYHVALEDTLNTEYEFRQKKDALTMCVGMNLLECQIARLKNRGKHE